MSKKCADGPGCTEIPLPEPNLPGFTYFLGMCEKIEIGQKSLLQTFLEIPWTYN
jgi:hypothetical protein